MSDSPEEKLRLSRRGFLTASAGIVAGASLGANATPDAASTTNNEKTASAIAPGKVIEPFWGARQGGILTPIQKSTYFAAFDITTTERDDIVGMLRTWTLAASRMTSGKTADALGEDLSVPAPDSADASDLSPSRLTITFGFGAGLFVKDGKDRFGLQAQRPAALVDMPKFPGDQMVEGATGGDLSVQACADDPQVAFHAVRQLARLAYNVADLRWVQTGFSGGSESKGTPRNLMGFKDGTNNPSVGDSKLMDQFVWVGDESPAWMRGGTYLVARRIRIALEHWDRMNVAFQEQTVGRKKYSGAPLGGKKEFDKADYSASDSDGNFVIPENSHVRLAAAEENDGAQILRRPYSYNDGANFTAERWPPWRQEMEFDAGLFFLCYQRDPRTGFIKLFDKMSKFDMMNQFVTPTGGGLFACPAGVVEGGYVGQKLFEKT